MKRDAGILALSLILLVQTIAGCATEEQTGAAVGTGIGAGVGALVGGLLGGQQGALIGAGAGAVVGAVAGWKIGEYHARQTRTSQQAAAAYESTAHQGVVAKIEQTDATPNQLNPGDQLVLQKEYTVLTPAQQGQVTVKEVRTIYFNNEQLHQFEQTKTMSGGTYITDVSLVLPKDTPKGRYTVTTLIEPIAVEKTTTDKADTGFRVR
jgi:predicted lipid-binding transport protein (Tim44 family)